MIVLVDYGVGNLFSLECSFNAVGEKIVVSSDPEIIKSAQKIVLPGVGAFRDAAAKLKKSGLGELVIEEAKKGKPVMGICLGMQLLFEKSYEFGEYEGLGLLKGEVKPIRELIGEGLKIPHIGWNALTKKSDNPLLGRVNTGEFVYYVHSYYADVRDDSLIAVSEYGAEITASVAKDNIFGCQFHPEKSGQTGLNILRAFCEDI